jgi:hypothetical protein
MTIRKENIVKETEKALQIIIGLRQCDNGKYMIVRGNGGYFKEVMAWVPKSQINTENEIPQWLATKILREAHLNITDEIFN